MDGTRRRDALDALMRGADDDIWLIARATPRGSSEDDDIDLLEPVAVIRGRDAAIAASADLAGETRVARLPINDLRSVGTRRDHRSGLVSRPRLWVVGVRRDGSGSEPGREEPVAVTSNRDRADAAAIAAIGSGMGSTCWIRPVAATNLEVGRRGAPDTGSAAMECLEAGVICAGVALATLCASALEPSGSLRGISETVMVIGCMLGLLSLSRRAMERLAELLDI